MRHDQFINDEASIEELRRTIFINYLRERSASFSPSSSKGQIADEALRFADSAVRTYVGAGPFTK